ncbi:MAG: ribonuclease P [Methanotrichaceae archaeon]|nr:ribonuclease P [Methanotrichaceae archaeon]
MRHRKKTHGSKEIARERMEILFALADAEYEQHPERSDRYVQIARQIGTRTLVRMPNHLKRRFCRKCDCYLPASRSRVRLHHGIVTVTCLRCGAVGRRRYNSERKKM